jgi:hypothetical protein
MGPKHPGGSALALGEHAKQDMLGPEVAVAAPLGLLAGKVQGPMGRLGEAAEHLATPRPGTIHPATPLPAPANARPPQA